jgi:Ubiquitin carboxyl-terminal hydrolase
MVDGVEALPLPVLTRVMASLIGVEPEEDGKDTWRASGTVQPAYAASLLCACQLVSRCWREAASPLWRPVYIASGVGLRFSPGCRMGAPATTSEWEDRVYTPAEISAAFDWKAHFGFRTRHTGWASFVTGQGGTGAGGTLYHGSQSEPVVWPPCEVTCPDSPEGNCDLEHAWKHGWSIELANSGQITVSLLGHPPGFYIHAAVSITLGNFLAHWHCELESCWSNSSRPKVRVPGDLFRQSFLGAQTIVTVEVVALSVLDGSRLLCPCHVREPMNTRWHLTGLNMQEDYWRPERVVLVDRSQPNGSLSCALEVILNLVAHVLRLPRRVFDNTDTALERIAASCFAAPELDPRLVRIAFQTSREEFNGDAAEVVCDILNKIDALRELSSMQLQWGAHSTPGGAPVVETFRGILPLPVWGMKNVSEAMTALAADPQWKEQEWWRRDQHSDSPCGASFRFAALPEVLLLQPCLADLNYHSLEVEKARSLQGDFVVPTTLDLSACLNSTFEGSAKYALKAAIVHNGGYLASEGWFSTLLQTTGGEWISLDGGIAAVVSESVVVETLSLRQRLRCPDGLELDAEEGEWSLAQDLSCGHLLAYVPCEEP